RRQHDTHQTKPPAALPRLRARHIRARLERRAHSVQGRGVRAGRFCVSGRVCGRPDGGSMACLRVGEGVEEVGMRLIIAVLALSVLLATGLVVYAAATGESCEDRGGATKFSHFQPMFTGKVMT